MKKKRNYTIAIILCGVSIVFLQVFMVVMFPTHTGTDDQSIELIQEIAPHYEPWSAHMWEPGSDAIEMVIFSTQAALGLGIIIFYILIQRKKVKTV